MEFNTTTFILEIINFLVLVWILQRLFYKPLREAIAQRQQHIEQSLTEAHSIKEAAEQQRELYENRQKVWEQEKQAALTVFHQEMDAERSQRLEKLQNELTQERQKHQVALNRQQQEFQHRAQQQALKNGAQFASLLLQKAATPELETQLVKMLLEHLNELPEACRLCLQLMENQQSIPIHISSAYPMTEVLQQQLESHFLSLIPLPLTFQYQQNPALIAGVRIDIGSWVLQANLQQELRGFVELAYESR